MRRWRKRVVQLSTDQPVAPGTFRQDGRPPNQLLFAPSVLRATDQWVYKGSLYQKDNRPFSLTGAENELVNIAKSAGLPLALERGGAFAQASCKIRNLLSSCQQALRNQNVLGTKVGQVSRGGGELVGRSPGPQKGMTSRELQTRACMHIPLLAKLLGDLELSGRGWIQQFISGFPLSALSEEPGVHQVKPEAPGPAISRELLIEGEKHRFKIRQNQPSVMLGGRRPPAGRRGVTGSQNGDCCSHFRGISCIANSICQ